jgi:D-inositol-3-phosphate glycosyltransferase
VVQDGVGGYLVEGHDPSDHADRLIQILRSPTLQAELGTRGARQALRFTWDATAAELQNVYRELLDARG